MKTINLNLKTIVIGALIIFAILVGFKLYQNRVNSLEAKLEGEIKLKNALIDTAKVYKNKENEWVTEKLSIQGTLKELQNKNLVLTTSQKELINRVAELNKDNTIIAAALIQTKIELKNLKDTSVIINKKDSSMVFNDSTKDLYYNIQIKHVLAANKLKPELNFIDFNLPNKQLIEFHWGDKKNDYPVSFSISNSNPYFKTSNVDSYTIPEINKDKIKPTGWQKIGNFFKKSGKIVLIVGGTVLGTILLSHL